ncbi:MAG: hypothetical protein MRY83_12145 [Flavobacteriales bacterium]|nr:hypothetical protein [Flavobacteriales bacterium]
MKIKKSSSGTILLCLIAFLSKAQLSLIDQFRAIPSEPQAISLTNSKHIPLGVRGHIQGIQYLTKGSRSYFILSGSSNDSSYAAVIGLKDEKATVDSIHILLGPPFRHAGGCQIFENEYFVGIEDNDSRKKSVIKTYNLDVNRQGALTFEEHHNIFRNGDYERVTAGATGAFRLNKSSIVAVGNWDSRDIDFYEKMDTTYVFVGSFNPITQKGKSWVKKEWLPYQNINFIMMKGEVYMFGFYGNSAKRTSTVHMFRMIRKDEGWDFEKVAERNFNDAKGCNMKSGGGVFMNPKGNLVFFAGPIHIESNCNIAIYGDIE